MHISSESRHMSNEKKFRCQHLFSRWKVVISTMTTIKNNGLEEHAVARTTLYIINWNRLTISITVFWIQVLIIHRTNTNFPIIFSKCLRIRLVRIKLENWTRTYFIWHFRNARSTCITKENNLFFRLQLISYVCNNWGIIFSILID